MCEHRLHQNSVDVGIWTVMVGGLHAKQENRAIMLKKPTFNLAKQNDDDKKTMILC